MPSHYVPRFYKSFHYQAASWLRSRRVVAKVEWHPGELFPRVGFIVTNLRHSSKNVVRFYNKRGTAEQWIKEGKGAVKWTRLSCRSFNANAVRLQLHALAYKLGQLPAHSGDSRGDRGVVADESSRQADQDRCQGRQTWPLRHLPDGRSRDPTAVVRCDHAEDRRAAITADGYRNLNTSADACAGITTGEVHPFEQAVGLLEARRAGAAFTSGGKLTVRREPQKLPESSGGDSNRTGHMGYPGVKGSASLPAIRERGYVRFTASMVNCPILRCVPFDVGPLVARAQTTETIRCAATGDGTPKGLAVVLPTGGRRDQSLNLQALNNPHMSGVEVQINWRDVEPVEGRPNWSRLDSLFGAAKPRSAGCSSASFRASFRRRGPWKGCRAMRSRSSMGPIMERLRGCRCRGTGVPRTLVHLRASTRAAVRRFAGVPHDPGCRTDVGFKRDDVAKLWRRCRKLLGDGYTPAKYLAAWDQTLRVFADAFPKQCVSLSGPSLPILAQGRIRSGRAPTCERRDRRPRDAHLGTDWRSSRSDLHAGHARVEAPDYTDFINGYSGRVITGFEMRGGSTGPGPSRDHGRCRQSTLGVAAIDRQRHGAERRRTARRLSRNL